MLRASAFLLFLGLPSAAVIAQAQVVPVYSAAGPEANVADNSSAPVASESAGPVVYTMADKMPAFPGGPGAFLEFLHDKVHYPNEALLRHLSGKVLISFVVDERGHILDPKVVRGLGAGLDEEALRLIRIMPWWTPGRINGQPVRVAYTLPIVFRILE
jgi:protein TonB